MHTHLLTRASGSLLLTGAFLLNLAAPIAAAEETHYSDVPSGAYYESAAAALLELGALDRSESRLRPSERATRAEMAKLLVNMHGDQLLYPSRPSFDDVPRSAWYYPYIETAANLGWMRGDRDCYKQFRPCTARPGDGLNRAEAAALLVRTFALERTDAAPDFADVPFGEWYYPHIQTAADHCIIQGDAGTERARPASSMNRAEMVVMFHRASEHMQYGEDCGTEARRITDVAALSSTRIRLSFSTDLRASRAEDETRYTVMRVSNSNDVEIDSAILIDDNTVELRLDQEISEEVAYEVEARNLETVSGVSFTDSARFTLNLSGDEAAIDDAEAMDSRNVRVTFTAALDESRAEDESRYDIERDSGGGVVTIQSARLVSARNVELTLDRALDTNTMYRVTVSNLETSGGDTFSDSMSFRFPEVMGGKLTSVAVDSPLRIFAYFDTDLDTEFSEDEIHYQLTSGTGGTIGISRARVVSNRVELQLGTSLQPQRSYTLRVDQISTKGGARFSDTISFIYAGTSSGVTFHSNLNGTQEVPSVTTLATGTGTFRLTNAGLEYDISVRNLTGTITGAHFHRGAAGVSGDVIQPITFTGNRATGTWNLSADHRNLLLNGQVYVNVHTTVYPNGEIRGQVTTP